MDKILEIANNILAEKRLPHININDDLKLCGFSSTDMLSLILRLEKHNYNVVNLAVQSITTVEDLHDKITNNTGGREIV